MGLSVFTILLCISHEMHFLHCRTTIICFILLHFPLLITLEFAFNCKTFILFRCVSHISKPLMVKHLGFFYISFKFLFNFKQFLNLHCRTNNRSSLIINVLFCSNNDRISLILNFLNCRNNDKITM